MPKYRGGENQFFKDMQHHIWQWQNGINFLKYWTKYHRSPYSVKSLKRLMKYFSIICENVSLNLVVAIMGVQMLLSTLSKKHWRQQILNQNAESEGPYWYGEKSIAAVQRNRNVSSNSTYICVVDVVVKY